LSSIFPSTGTLSDRVNLLERLEAAVGDERRSVSPVAAALPAMLVALGWVGTARSLAALLPPPDVPVTLDHLELLLPVIGYRTYRNGAAGSRSDTERQRTPPCAFGRRYGPRG
jgi:hypothetical protein